MRLIDADELRNEVDNYDFSEYSDYSNMIDMIDDAPTIEAEPVKHGRWIYGEDEIERDGIFCSECRHFVPWCYGYYDESDDLINDNSRCPNCGARMDGGINNE